MKYLLWDWNGTLLDDTRASVDALNALLAKRGAPAVSLSFFRDHFAFPVRPFYERVGMRLEEEDWDALAKEYHDLYAAQPKSLNEEAKTVLARARGLGIRQSIISALRQDLLEAVTAAYGVAEYMDHICGSDNLDGASKLMRARELLETICADGKIAPADVVMIGDALHDKEVADDLGVRCVLFAQGSHAGWRLRKAAPTGETLTEVLTLALNLD